MLQRVQSIYFLLASLAIFALFLFPLVHNVYVDAKPVSIMVTGVYQDLNGAQANTHSFTGLTIATVIVGLLPLALIFLFKNRKQQMMLSWGVIVAIIAYSYWVAQTVKGVTGELTLQTSNMGIGLLLSSISIIFIIFAIKGIQRDEKLIKSADRLR